MDKKRKFFILLFIVISLFLIPQTWNKWDFYNLGGDDSRLYLYSPWHWLNNVAMHSWFYISGLAFYNPQQAAIPFSLLMSIIKNIFPFLNIQKLLWGLTLSLGFLSAYFILGELVWDKKNRYSFTAAIISGLSYIFLPILFYSEWSNSLYNLPGIFTFPLLLLFFIKAINQKKVSYLIFGSIVGLIFSLSIFSFQWSYAFLIGCAVFLFFYFILIEKDKVRFIKYLIIYVCIFVLLGSFWILPFLYSTISDSHAYQSMSDNFRKSAVSTINTVIPYMNIYDTLSGLLSRNLIFHFRWPIVEIAEYTYNMAFLNILMPIIIFSGLLIKGVKNLRESKLLTALCITVLMLAYFQTVNIGMWGQKLFIAFTRNVFGWVMFRNFYAKFPIAYAFFYSIALGIAIYIILQHITKKIIKAIVVIAPLTIIMLQSVPFIHGDINNLPHLLGEEITKKNIKIPQYYKDAMKYLENLDESRILTLPLTFATWSIFRGLDNKGIYIGGSPIKVFTGKDNFNGKMDFESVAGLPDRLSTALANNDYQRLKYLFGLLNVQYIFYNSDIYNLSAIVQQKYLWNHSDFSNKVYVEHLIDNIAKEKMASYGPISVYKLSNEFILPRVYASTSIDRIPQGSDGSPEIVFKKINPTKYIIKVDGAKKPFWIIFNERFHDKWKLYIMKDRPPGELEARHLMNFTPQDIRLLFRRPLELRHQLVNSYANGWYVEPEDLNLGESFTLTLYFWPQVLFYLGLAISGLTLIGCIFYREG